MADNKTTGSVLNNLLKKIKSKELEKIKSKDMKLDSDWKITEEEKKHVHIIQPHFDPNYRTPLLTLLLAMRGAYPVNSEHLVKIEKAVTTAIQNLEDEEKRQKNPGYGQGSSTRSGKKKRKGSRKKKGSRKRKSSRKRRR